MLYLYAGNRLERLADALAETLRAPLPGPFDREVLVVQSRGMARWLALRLAERIGVWAQAEFLYPAVLIERLCADPRGERWPDRDGLVWAVWDLLPALLPRPEFDALRGYLADDPDGVKRIQLSRRAADALDKYSAYRPDLIRNWERGEIGADADERWQASLWSALTERYGRFHRAARQESARRRMIAGEAPEGRLPPRLAVFGITALPPAQMDFFEALARRTDVYFFALNPCRAYWGDLRSEREQASLLARAGAGADPTALHLEVGHPLLANMGRAGRHFFDRLIDANAVEPSPPLYESPGEDTLLARLQSDLLDLRAPPGPAAPGAAPCRYDDSIRVFSCHSRMREVEVLRDRLLALFETRPGLEPRDVIVMAPDIERYAAAIEAVFERPGDRTPRIPYSIADRPAGAGNAAARALSLALRLLEGRFGFAEVMALYDLDPVRRGAGLTETELDRVRDRLREARARWGIDAEHRAALGQPRFAECTWRAAFERLLPAATDGAPDAAPDPDLAALRRFRDHLEILFEAAARVREPRAPREWAEELDRLFERWIAGADDESAEVARAALAGLRAAAAHARGEGRATLRALRTWLDDRWAGERPTSPYLARGVTFGNLVPMRGIPFRVVALLGMNDGDYPRREAAAEFDLVARHPRPGDRNRRAEDRYLFLEAVLSARDALLISYVGQSIRDNSERPASTLVRELLEALGGAAAEAALLVRHPLQPFSARYFAGQPDLFTYSSDAAEAAARRAAPNPAAAAEPPLALPDDLREPDLDALAAYFGNPARFWFERRLDARVEERPPPPDDAEPMDLDGLDRYLLRREVARRLETEDPPADRAALELELRRLGLLPHATPGALALDRALNEVLDYLEQLKKERGASAPRTVAVDLPLTAFHLRGTVDSIYGGRIVHGRPAAVRATDRLQAWVRHLAANAVEGNVETALVGTDEVVRFRALDPDTARGQLDRLGRHYLEGLRRPLPFYPQTSLAFAAGLAAKDDPDAARRAAGEAWLGGFADRPGEYDADLWLPILLPPDRCRAALDDEFERLAVEIAGPLIAACAEP